MGRNSPIGQSFALSATSEHWKYRSLASQEEPAFRIYRLGTYGMLVRGRNARAPGTQTSFHAQKCTRIEGIASFRAFLCSLLVEVARGIRGSSSAKRVFANLVALLENLRPTKWHQQAVRRARSRHVERATEPQRHGGVS